MEIIIIKSLILFSVFYFLISKIILKLKRDIGLRYFSLFEKDNNLEKDLIKINQLKDVLKNIFKEGLCYRQITKEDVEIYFTENDVDIYKEALDLYKNCESIKKENLITTFLRILINSEIIFLEDNKRNKNELEDLKLFADKEDRTYEECNNNLEKQYIMVKNIKNFEYEYLDRYLYLLKEDLNKKTH